MASLKAAPSTSRSSWTSWRRLFRFRLLTLLLVVTAICIGLAIAFQREPITAQNLKRLYVVQRTPQEVSEIEWTADGQRMAFVGWEKAVEIRDSVTHVRLRTLGEGKKIIHFAFSPDPNVVAWCENCKDVELVNLATGQTKLLEVGDSQPQPVFSPDGKWLATGGYGTKVKIWEVATTKVARELNTGNEPGGLRPVFSPDGSLVAVGNRNSETTIFERESGNVVAKLSKPSTHELEFHPDGKLLAVAYVDGNVALYEMPVGKRLALVQTPLEEAYCVEWFPDGTLLVVGGKGGATIVYDRDLKEVAQLSGPPWISDLRFSRDGKQLFRSGGEPFLGGKRQLEVLMVRSKWLGRWSWDSDR